MKTLIQPRLGYLLLLTLFLQICSCTKHHHDDPKPALDFQTGPATFMQPGGVIHIFRVVFNELGNDPIEEYGILYTFDEDVATNYPDLTDNKITFDLLAKQYTNEKTVNIGFPAGTHWLGFRAYVKLKGGEVKYAEPVITSF